MLASDIMSGNTAYMTVGVASSTCLLVGLVAFFAVRRIRSSGHKSWSEGLRIVNKKASSWYDPACQKLVPEQVGRGEAHAEEGLLAVVTPVKRTVSAECLFEPRKESVTSEGYLSGTKHLSVSSLSLTSIGSEHSLRRESYTLRSSPYVEFNLLWATSTACLSVYVIRITSLPPTYANATCSYKVTLHKPDNKTLSRSSNKVRKVNLNPDCFQVFSFPVPLEEVQRSELELEVYARKSKRFLSKTLGHLRYPMPLDLSPDSPVTTSQPLIVNRNGSVSTPSSPRGGSLTNPFATHQWGEVQILAQYQITGGWQGRIKIMVIKAQNSLIGKRGGSYKMELIIKREEDTESVYQTKQVQGPNPVWKTPFIFDVTQSKVNDYRVEMNLIRTGRMKKDTFVGQAVLGLGTTPSGTKHWEDLVTFPNKEFTMWHPVMVEED